jgi:hypothetical protein
MAEKQAHSPDLFDGWTLWVGEDGAFQISAGEHRVIVSRGRLPETEDSIALAHLLHAAPDLLAACRVAATAELYDPATGIIDADVLEAVQEVARAALTKAEGA